jgi:hypothetical protein
MNFTNVDTICRRTLLAKGLPIHYYFEMLVHVSSCLRELNIDTLKVINTVKLPVNSYYAVDIPVDAMDILGVSIPAGQRLQPVMMDSSITPLRNVDSDGDFAPYGTTSDSEDSDDTFSFAGGWTWFWNVSDWGEPTGRYFGASGGAKLNGYTVVKERRQIQLTETFTSDEIVVMYLSDGQSIDNASKVDILAWATIEAYINWKRSPRADNEFSPEGSAFYNQRRRLVA